MVKRSVIILLLIVGLLGITGAAQAGTVPVNGFVLTYPDSVESCDLTPSSTFSLTGTGGLEVTFYFYYRPAGQAGEGIPFGDTLFATGDVLNRPYPYGSVPVPLHVGMQFGVQAKVWSGAAEHSDLVAVLTALKWSITCKPEETPTPTPTVTPTPSLEGCTPGYWRNHLSAWEGYLPSQYFEIVFGVDASAPWTLGQAVRLGGGGEQALARHAVAALLNAAKGLDYPYTASQVINMVKAAYASGSFEATKNLFANANEINCPLN